MCQDIKMAFLGRTVLNVKIETKREETTLCCVVCIQYMFVKYRNVSWIRM